MKTVIVQPPYGGMTRDKRGSASGATLVKHFDCISNKSQLTPYRDTEEAFTAATQAQVQLQSFLMYAGNMYALGRQAAVARALIYKNTGIASPSWSTPTNGQDGTYTISNYTLFTEYKGLLWGTNSNGLWSYDIAGTTFTAGAQALTYSGVTQGLVHSQDSIFYFGYYNSTAAYIASKNAGGSWDTTALTIPTTTHKPVSICEYGNFIAILMAPIYTGSNSFVLFWDRDSTQNTLSDLIDVGNSDGVILENTDAGLLAISTLSGPNSTSNTKILFSRYNGINFEQFDELEISYLASVSIKKQKYNNRIYFMLSFATSLGGTTNDYSGLWSIGKSGDKIAISFDRTPKNDTRIHQMLGFIIISDYVYSSYLVTNGGSDFELSKTSDQLTYTTTSVWETKINPNMPLVDTFKLKPLGAIGVFVDRLSDGQVVVKYKVDGGSFSSALITKTATSPNADLIAYELPANAQLTNGREFEFRVESTGGAKVTGLAYTYDNNVPSPLFL